ncbi:MAG TPA: FkbM family methyltransferase [Chitinophagaceae bacterium]|nr:FkbM family methyltransferase [Chitinophagaceae bacterium]
MDLVIDVGANTGIFGKELRMAGYNGAIVSFEPLRDAFQILSSVANQDPDWEVNNFALGQENSKQEINISGNSHSSSILEMLDTHTNAEASAAYIGKQEIEIRKLDTIFPEVAGKAKEIFLKIDTQGFEMNVLKGASNSLDMINTVQLEMSLHPLYSGQALYNDIMSFFHQRGYKLIDIDPGFADLRTGVLYQFDGIFRKSEQKP